MHSVCEQSETRFFLTVHRSLGLEVTTECRHFAFFVLIDNRRTQQITLPFVPVHGIKIKDL